MAAVNPPFAIQARADHPARLFRELLSSLRGQAGVVGAADLAVTQTGTPSMQISVAAGKCVVDGTQSPAAQGSYLCYNDAAALLTIAAADATNPRNDLITAQVQDAEYAGAANQWLLAVVQGTAAASPVDPAVPANTLILARVRVNAAASSIVNANITDLRPLGVIVNQAVVPLPNASAAAIGASPLAARADHIHQGSFLFDDQSPTGATMRIPASGSFPTGKNIVIYWLGKCDQAAVLIILMQMSGDTGANYDYQVNQISGTSVLGGLTANTTSIRVGVAADSTAGVVNGGVIKIPGFAMANRHPIVFDSHRNDQNIGGGHELGSATYKVAAAITFLNLLLSAAGNFTAPSRFMTYIEP